MNLKENSVNQFGKYIVIEGGDGVGKTTQVELIIKNLIDKGIDAIGVTEPGPTEIGLKLRADIDKGEISDDPNIQLARFTEDRRATWQQITHPALKMRKTVVASRNWFSSVAYQGFGGGISTNQIISQTINDVGQDYFKPDFSIVMLNKNKKQLNDRIAKRYDSSGKDHFETKDAGFQKRVQEGYDWVAKNYADLILETNSKTINEVNQELMENIAKKLLVDRQKL